MDIMGQGYGIIPKSIMRDKNLSLEAKAIYSYIASFAGAGKKAFPGVELMLKELKIGRTRFYKYRDELESKGYIKIFQTRNGNRNSNNVYELVQHITFEQSQNEQSQNEQSQNEQSQNEQSQNEHTTINSLTINSLTNNRENEKTRSLGLTKEEYNYLIKKYPKDIVDMIQEKAKKYKGCNNITTIEIWIQEKVENLKRKQNKPVEKKKVNQFNNFHQRNYTKEELDEWEIRMLTSK